MVKPGHTGKMPPALAKYHAGKGVVKSASKGVKKGAKKSKGKPF